MQEWEENNKLDEKWRKNLILWKFEKKNFFPRSFSFQKCSNFRPRDGNKKISWMQSNRKNISIEIYVLNQKGAERKFDVEAKKNFVWKLPELEKNGENTRLCYSHFPDFWFFFYFHFLSVLWIIKKYQFIRIFHKQKYVFQI